MKNKEIKEKKIHLVKIIYENEHKEIKESLQPFNEGDYQEELSYRENLQNLITEVAADGGLWVDNNTIVPYHQIKAFCCHIPKPKKRRIIRRRHSNPISIPDSKTENN